MTTTETEAEAEAEPAVTEGRRRRVPVWLMVVVAALLGIGAYLVSFGSCDTTSKFCYVGLAGTRSEVVVAWLDEFDVYTQTAPSSTR
ncbi:hypothetical protein CSH63_18010 [Micromonospora tulbaghiae]|uniref:Uncharacterized protein n=1 Tax=Micromonospora tulbaghiae TaxID=479978 RepID=A0A386WLV0_9ACTN|nr:hypothetical protein CSH63_18010 [Micromonospora tulbaghiae]